MKRILLYSLALIIVFFSIILLFTIEMNLEKNEIENIGIINEKDMLPIPDRIIYKNKDGKYVIINHEDKECQYIYNELYRRINSISNGKVYQEDEITQMQDKGSFIEFDYNTKSKNFVFLLEETEIGVIKRLADSGQVIKITLNEKEELIRRVEHWTKTFTKYNFNREKVYNEKSNFDKIPNNLEFKEVEPGIHQKIINYNDKEFKGIIQSLNIEFSENTFSFDSEKESVVITLSKYEIKSVRQNIGNIKYQLGEYKNKYFINILVVSKIVNTNCIYFNKTANNSIPIRTEEISTSSDKYAVNYYKENNKCYTNYNNQRIEIISEEEACELADLEAKKEKYQYQSWKSEFYSRGKDKRDTIIAELISNLSEISRIYHWREEWKMSDYNNKLMWKVRLFDMNDPLTNLYIYVDATNGNIIGAGEQSD